MANNFVSVLEQIGKDFEIGLTAVIKFLPLGETIAGFVFPEAVIPMELAGVIANLLQMTILEVEQKYSAAGNQNETGEQKLATVLTIVTGAVTALLAQPNVAAALVDTGIVPDAAYVARLVNGVVSFLNLQPAINKAI